MTPVIDTDQPASHHRNIFELTRTIITMQATGVVYLLLGDGLPLQLTAIAKPVVAAISTYFIVNTVLVAAAATRPDIAAAAAVVYVLAYTFELGLSLITYFGNSR